MKKNIEDKKFDRTLLDKYFTVVLAGRPNVGKSTLFNALCSKRIAIEFSKPGTTRDPVEKTVRIDETDILLVDTGGFEFQSHDPLYIDVGLKAKFYIQNADLVLFMVEKDKIIDEDLAFLRYIKRYSRDYILVINKCEGKYPELFSKDIYQLGVPVMFPICTVQRENIGELEDFILNK
ncbi:MAG TPA: 50S ribosome-binding GTPase, partial [Exilispira sp.]|nr:50S ribosome-binding GTPase [Exilispira sp.]